VRAPNVSAGPLSSAPSLIGWDLDALVRFQERLRDGDGIVVRYTGDATRAELEVVPECTAPGHYSYVVSASSEGKTLRGPRELEAELPIGGAAFAAQMSPGHAVRVDAEIAGKRTLGPARVAMSSFSAADLRGFNCERATHVVVEIQVGAFAMVSGDPNALSLMGRAFGAWAARSTLAAAGGSKSFDRHSGNADACVAARTSGKVEPQCFSPVRLSVRPVTRSSP
jgi:hypothetical protein